LLPTVLLKLTSSSNPRQPTSQPVTTVFFILREAGRGVEHCFFVIVVAVSSSNSLVLRLAQI